MVDPTGQWHAPIALLWPTPRASAWRGAGGGCGQDAPCPRGTPSRAAGLPIRVGGTRDAFGNGSAPDICNPTQQATRQKD